jgi:hypothetical protein
VLDAVRRRIVRQRRARRVRKHALRRVHRASRRLRPSRRQRRRLRQCVRVRVDLQTHTAAARLACVARARHVAVTHVRRRQRAVHVARGAQALIPVLDAREREPAVAAERDARRRCVRVRELVVLGRPQDARGRVDCAAVGSRPPGREGDLGGQGRGRHRGRCSRGGVGCAGGGGR